MCPGGPNVLGYKPSIGVMVFIWFGVTVIKRIHMLHYHNTHIYEPGRGVAKCSQDHKPF